MIDLIVKFLANYGYYVLALLLIVKLFLFFNYRTRNWKVQHILFFDQRNLADTADGNREKIKRLQNILSLLLFMFALLLVVITIIDPQV